MCIFSFTKRNKMNLTEINLNKLNLELRIKEMKMEKSPDLDVFNYKTLNMSALFFTFVNQIPNVIEEKNIDCKLASQDFFRIHESKINRCYYNKVFYDENSKRSELDDLYFFLHEDLLVSFNINYQQVFFLFFNTPYLLVEEIIERVKTHRIKINKEKPYINLLIANSRGFSLERLEIKIQKGNFVMNYNDDFTPISQLIFKRLSKNNDKGIVVLHGKPGTGKTSYIRHLISKVKKNVIFLPPNMANAITNPDLITTLIQNPNSIFVIEDAENIVVKREKNSSSAVSALLNLSDGLLSDCLNIQIICSFNTNISNVDEALLRKGRLIAQYEFKELTIEKAQNLSNKLGFDSIIKSPMTLSDVYNQTDIDF